LHYRVICDKGGACLAGSLTARRRRSLATPLFIAASNNDRTMVKMLLDAGADVNWTVRASAQAEPGGPLWHVIEHVLERVLGGQSPKDALELVRATAGQSRP
jgi:ankyrin repeat protein